MIRIERVSLPPGLRAVTGRDARGDLVIYVSDALDARRQHTAIMAAVRAARRAGWLSAVPAWIALVTTSRLWLGRAASAIRSQPVVLPLAAAAAAAIVVAGIIVTTTTPHHHVPAQAAAPSAGRTGASQSPGAQPGNRPGRQVQPAVAPPSSSPTGRSRQSRRGTTGSGQASPDPGQPSSPATTAPTSSPPASSSPATSSSPSPAPSSPTAAPSPSPAPSQSCLVVLGIRICTNL